MKLTAADIAEIARLLDESKFASLDLQMGDFRVRIRRDGSGWTAPASEQPRQVEAAPDPAPIASPDGPAAGETVTEDTTIGIIEVMKLMNPIRAGVAGTVTAILTANGTSVEEGQPLIRVRAV